MGGLRWATKVVAMTVVTESVETVKGVEAVMSTVAAAVEAFKCRRSWRTGCLCRASDS